MTTEKQYCLQVSETEENQRIDIYLAQHMGISRSHAQKIIAANQVWVNTKIVKANYKVACNDYVKAVLPEVQPAEIKAEAIPLSVVYEDDHMIIINKPRGMVVHPAAGNYSGTLVNALLEHCRDLSGINGVIRPGIVHRLDKDTSGVMVAAKTDQAHLNLALQIKDREASRKYIAIVHGNIKEEQGVINAPIGRHPVDRKKMAVVFANSKTAITNFKTVERFGNYTVVECKLETGRTHQIRVHMAHIGHPVVGDPKYGPEKSHFSINGQALHSAQLSLSHPVTGEKMCFSAPIPADMETIIASLRRVK